MMRNRRVGSSSGVLGFVDAAPARPVAGAMAETGKAALVTGTFGA